MAGGSGSQSFGLPPLASDFASSGLVRRTSSTATASLDLAGSELGPVTDAPSTTFISQQGHSRLSAATGSILSSTSPHAVQDEVDNWHRNSLPLPLSTTLGSNGAFGTVSRTLPGSPARSRASSASNSVQPMVTRLSSASVGELPVSHPLSRLSMVRRDSEVRQESVSNRGSKSPVLSEQPLVGSLAHGDKVLHRMAVNKNPTAEGVYIDESKVALCSWCSDTLKAGEDDASCECSSRLCHICRDHVKKYENDQCPICGLPLLSVEQYNTMQHLMRDEDTPRNSVSLPDGHTRESEKGQKEAESRNDRQVIPVGDELVPVSLADYGYGSVTWQSPPPQSTERAVPRLDAKKRALSRKLGLPGGKIGPYRILVIVRLLSLIAYLQWRVKTPMYAGFWLWILSIICEIWFAFSWVLDTIPKMTPVIRETYKDRLRELYDEGGERLPQVDVFITTADASKEPPLSTACTILSVLASDYPAERLAVYLSDDGSSKLQFDAMAETAGFARLWVPFCKRFSVEPRSPEAYFSHKLDFLRDKIHPDFVKTRRRVKREYEEFKVRMNALVDQSRRPPTDGWLMPDGTPWPGNNRRNHDGIIQVFLHPDGDIRDVEGGLLPPLVYMAREKRPGHDHNKKAGAMNALMRASALISNGTFIFNLDCDHYVNNCQAVREALCFFLDPIKGYDIGFVQFPQRFDGIDKSDRYANHNTVFFDINMKGLDGQQGPVYVGTGCFFRRKALYGYYPPANPSKRGVKKAPKQRGCWGGKSCCCCGCCRPRTKKSDHPRARLVHIGATSAPTRWHDEENPREGLLAESSVAPVLSLRLGLCTTFVESVKAPDEAPQVAEGTGGDGRAAAMLSDVVLAISCDYEENTDWGSSVGWMYGSVTEDILTGMKLHSRGWTSAYCDPERAAFKGSAPLNMTDRLQQVERWATGAVEIFFSGRNPLWALWGTLLQLRQRLAYANNAFYPFTSVAIFVYCLLPPLALLSDYFFVPTLDREGVICFTALILSFLVTSILELRWSGVTFESWWRNEQFWVIAGISSHFAAVIQGILKMVAGIEIAFTLTSKLADGDDVDELHTFKFTWLLLPGTFIGLFNIVGVIVGFGRAISATGGTGQWGRLLGKLVFSFWVLIHLYPFAKGMMGRRSKMPTLVLVWSVLLVIVVALLWSNFFGGGTSVL